MFPVKLSCLIFIGYISLSGLTHLKEIQRQGGGRETSITWNEHRKHYHFPPSFMSCYGVI